MGFSAGDSDLYRYVFNAPTDRIDPSGLVSPTDPKYGQYIATTYYESILRNAMYKSRVTGQPIDPGAVQRAAQAYKGAINSFNTYLKNNTGFLGMFKSPPIEQRVPLPNSTLIEMWDQTFDNFKQDRQTSFRYAYYLAMAGMWWDASAGMFVQPSSGNTFLFNQATRQWTNSVSGEIATGAELAEVESQAQQGAVLIVRNIQASRAASAEAGAAGDILGQRAYQLNIALFRNWLKAIGF